MAEDLEVTPQKVIEELCADPLGKALWERASWKVVAESLAQRLSAMESDPVPEGMQAPTERPSAGWDVPNNER